VLDQARKERLARIGRLLEVQLINEALATAAAMHDEILQLFELVQVAFELRVAPAGVMAHVAAAEAIIAAFHL